MSKDYTFNFDDLKNRKDIKRIYKNEIYKWIDKQSSGVWSIIDKDRCISHHLKKDVIDFLITKSLSNGHINRDKQILYVDTHLHRSGTKERYILVPRRLHA